MSNRYRLDLLSWKEFENLIILLCDRVLGIGVNCFSDGADGGRDARFEGRANAFPSESQPLEGKFVVQAKHTANPVASCSDYDFENTILGKETPRVKRLVSEGECEIYLLFTNRKLTAGKENEHCKLIATGTGLSEVHIRGLERIELILRSHPDIVRTVGLDKLMAPMNIHPDDLANVVIEFEKHQTAIDRGFDSAHSLDYLELASKNELNTLTVEYFNYIRENSEPYFGEIETFLKDPINRKIAVSYHNTADELKGKLIANRARFATFDEALGHIYDAMIDGNDVLLANRQLTNVFLHYMYCNCDIGVNHVEAS